MFEEKESFFKPERLGLRKINVCILTEPNLFGKYFNSKYFNNISTLLTDEGFTSTIINSQLLDTVFHEKFLFNYLRTISEGILTIGDKDKIVYQVILDIDGYTYDKERLNDILDNPNELFYELAEVNDALFNLFIKTLNTEFITKLKTDGVEWENIIGVKANGKIED